MSKALRAADVAAELPSETELRQPVLAAPRIEGHGIME
jgi:hypothetical protein